MTTRRPTSVWLPIDTLVPHPANPNRMPEEVLAKLEANIESSGGLYPPIIARSLELSQSFRAEFEAGQIQIMDGEHRWVLAKRRGDKEVEVRVWQNVTDHRAWKYLLTINSLRGRDDAKKRNFLIRGLSEVEEAEILASVLPEDLETIKKTAAEAAKDAVGRSASRAEKLSLIEPMTIFGSAADLEVIRRAMKTWLDRFDGRAEIQDGREAHALARIGEIYLESGP